MSRTSPKISTHYSSPDIFNFCISSGFGGEAAVHVQPNFLQVHTQKLKSFNLFQLQIPKLFLKVSSSIHLYTPQVPRDQFAWDRKGDC